MHDLSTYNDVIIAVARIIEHAGRTPVMFSCTLDEELGARVPLKCESLQRMGAFKFHGAFNAPSRFSARQRAAGVVTFSPSSHAWAATLPAHLLRIPTVIVMPADMSAVGIEATRDYGEQVVLYDRYTEDREQIGCDLAQRHDLTLIPPYDHPDALVGQDTAVKEPFEEVGPLDVFFAPLGGGGLLSGCVLAIHVLVPACRIYGAEPEAGNDGQRSLRNDAIVYIDTLQILTDGTQVQHLGDLTFPLIQRNVDDILTVSSTELVDDIRFLVTRVKLLVEFTGCLGLAAARQRKDELRGKWVGILFSGGSVGLVRFYALLGG